MRVIGGEFRSRRLKSLPGLETRPTPDRLRESLFSILTPRIEGAVFMDAYAGTGAVGIEALSRGARHAIFVDKRRAAVEVIRQNLAELGLITRAEVFCGKAIQVIDRIPVEILFLDPPYELEQEYEKTLVIARGFVIVQHSVRAKLKDTYGELLRTRIVRQGDNHLSFYEDSGSPLKR